MQSQLMNKLKKGLSYFDPKREVECDGTHTKPLNL